VLALMVWWALPAWTEGAERVARVRDARVLAVWLVSLLLYGNTLLPARWVERL
jgi:hypothetical protein